MKSHKIKIGDIVNYKKNMEFGPAKVVKILQNERGCPRLSENLRDSLRD